MQLIITHFSSTSWISHQRVPHLPDEEWKDQHVCPHFEESGLCGHRHTRSCYHSCWGS